MDASSRVRWIVEPFDPLNLPDNGYVFFSRCRSYVCRPSRPDDFSIGLLAKAIIALRPYLNREPPGELLISGQAVINKLRIELSIEYRSAAAAAPLGIALPVV